MSTRNTNILLGVVAFGLVLTIIAKNRKGVHSNNFGANKDVQLHMTHASQDARGLGQSSLAYIPGLMRDNIFGNLDLIPQPSWFYPSPVSNHY